MNKLRILIVEDNGKGFKPTTKNGIGLMNIESRLDTLTAMLIFNQVKVEAH